MTDVIFDFICTYFAKHGCAPSQREIAQNSFLSKTAIVRYLERLEAQGRITRVPGVARNIRLVDEKCDQNRDHLDTQITNK